MMMRCIACGFSVPSDFIGAELMKGHLVDHDKAKLRMVVFIFKCRNKHVVEVAEERAKEINGTACQVCYSPLLIAGVKR